jgi:PAS domain S-box-containing protein
VWVCGPDGSNTYASESFLRLIGMTQQQCAGYGWGKALHPDDLEPTIAAWRECVRSGSNWYREHRVLGKDGFYHPVLAQGVPMRDDNGNITGWAGINLDISPLKKTEAALREADRRKDEFLATLAHELRNPLGPISHAVTILTAPLVTPTQQQWARDVITRQMKHMTLLLDDLLDVSRITRGRLELKKEDVDLQSLVYTAIETARPLITSKHHTLNTFLPAQPVVLNVDPLRMGQAITNLLTNAAKYTDVGGDIALTADIGADELTIAVKDNGIGMSASVIPNVFEMFSQVESALDRSQGGLGIGLALVKGMVQLHGGRIEATSGGPGLGSCFTIHLPYSCVVTDSNVMQPSSTDASAKLSPARILVVDDNLDAAQCLAFMLELSGHNVVIARSGQQAITIAASEQPHIVILDIGMPEMNGYEVAQHIRQQSWGKQMILVAVSGWGQSEDKERARVAGFNQHFTKPVNSDDLEQWLASNHAIPTSATSEPPSSSSSASAHDASVEPTV